MPRTPPEGPTASRLLLDTSGHGGEPLTVTTVSTMPRLEVLSLEGDLNTTFLPPQAGTRAAIEEVTKKREAVGRRVTGYYLSTQRFLLLRLEHAPLKFAMHIEPLYNSEGMMVKAAMEILGVPVFEDVERLDTEICWSEVAA